MLILYLKELLANLHIYTDIAQMLMSVCWMKTTVTTCLGVVIIRLEASSVPAMMGFLEME